MACQKRAEAPNRTSTPTTKHIDVTDLTLNERRELFADCMKKDGFRGFIQHTKNNHTHYAFHYQN